MPDSLFGLIGPEEGEGGGTVYAAIARIDRQSPFAILEVNDRGLVVLTGQAWSFVPALQELHGRLFRNISDAMRALEAAYRSEWDLDQGGNMTTQTELREAVSYSDIQRVAGALFQRDTWRDAWTGDTMHALGWELSDLMGRANVSGWKIGDVTITPRRVLNPKPGEMDRSVRVAVPGMADRFYGFGYQGPRRFYTGTLEDGTAYGPDPEQVEDWIRMTVSATIYPDIAFLCDNCEGPHWSDTGFEPMDTGEDALEVACTHCGALGMQGVHCDCAHFGRDTCQLHGARLVPMALVLKHDADAEAASAEYLQDDRALRVAQRAARPDGIWQFPNGILRDMEAGS